MSRKNPVLKIALVIVAAVFAFNTSAAAQCCSAEKTKTAAVKAGDACSMKTTTAAVKAGDACSMKTAASSGGECTSSGCPEQKGKEVIHSSKVDCPGAKGRDCDAVVWSEQGRGYALVADSCCAMKCISGGSK